MSSKSDLTVHQKTARCSGDKLAIVPTFFPRNPNSIIADLSLKVYLLELLFLTVFQFILLHALVEITDCPPARSIFLRFPLRTRPEIAAISGKTRICSFPAPSPLFAPTAAPMHAVGRPPQSAAAAHRAFCRTARPLPWPRRCPPPAAGG